MDALPVICAVAACLCINMSFGLVPSDEITSLPGLAFKPSYKQYSGYLKANNNHMLHYWFVESQSNPKTDPVVLWLNGGPGCSSLDGFLSEHGPFLIQPGGSLTDNPYSWNKVANMLYIEAPAGVGYSFSPDKNYATDDDKVSADNLVALQYFFSVYPEFKGNDFYITGESYGGIYVPTLAVRVVDSQQFNFKGFAVGNGLSSNALNINSIVYFGYYHGLWGSSLWKDLLNSCCPENNNTDIPFCDFYQHRGSFKCIYVLSQIDAVINSLNIYNMYADCYTGPAKGPVVYTSDLLLQHAPWASHRLQLLNTSKVKLVPPCINATAITAYLNDQNVRMALHIPNNLPAWQICSEIVGGSYKRLYADMTTQYQYVLQQGTYRVLIYNGDIDMACNFLGDEWFADSLNAKIIQTNSVWKYTAADGSTQIGGYIKQFQNLWFATVKGAGHMVPQDKPVPALVLFKAFLANKSPA